jgi:hypothetical protein
MTQAMRAINKDSDLGRADDMAVDPTKIKQYFF